MASSAVSFPNSASASGVWRIRSGVQSESDLRADFALPRNSVTCSYSNSWISRWTGFSPNPPTAPPPAFDSDLLPVLPFPIGGVSPPLGLKPVLFTEGVHRLTVYFLPNLAELEWNLKTASQESSKD